jgi:predicted amidophosphoribosyltransferase
VDRSPLGVGGCGYREPVLGRALDVVFPQRCGGCGLGAWPFCDACRATLVPLLPPWCDRCGRPWNEPVDRCRDCPPAEIDRARGAFRFDEAARRAIHRLKFSGWRGVGSALAEAMVVVDDPPVVDVVTWVPLSRRRLAERGYDQAKVLARRVAARIGRPAAGLLRRSVSTAPQARRDVHERRSAMRGVFDPRAGADIPARVLLVDDVLTTGATAAASADALRRGGASTVHLLVAARAFPGARTGISSLPGSRPGTPRPRSAPRPGEGGAYTRPSPRPGLWLPGDDPR